MTVEHAIVVNKENSKMYAGIVLPKGWFDFTEYREAFAKIGINLILATSEDGPHGTEDIIYTFEFTYPLGMGPYICPLTPYVNSTNRVQRVKVPAGFFVCKEDGAQMTIIDLSKGFYEITTKNKEENMNIYEVFEEKPPVRPRVNAVLYDSKKGFPFLFLMPGESAAPSSFLTGKVTIKRDLTVGWQTVVISPGQWLVRDQVGNLSALETWELHDKYEKVA